MKTSQLGIQLIKEFEGLRTSAYRCPAGIWTIGYGHTSGVFQGQIISEKQAEIYLKEDLQKFEQAVLKSLKVIVSQNQFDALVSLCFNIGITAFNRSTLLRYLNSGNFSLAANQFDRWVFANNVRLSGLVRRRTAEKALFVKQ